MRYSNEAHQRMLPPAILRAHPAAFSWAICFDPQQCASPGDHVLLSREMRHPKAVDHIGGFQFEHHRTSDGNVNLIRIFHHNRARWVQILHTEPPHFTGNANTHLVPVDRLCQAGRKCESPHQ